METVACKVCGKLITARAKLKRVTCSMPCSRVWSQRVQKGRKQTSPAFYAAKRGFPGPRAHPRTGRFETNCHALEWYIRSPEGDEFVVRNLKLFMEERYGEEFGRKVAAGLSRANARFKRNGSGSSFGWVLLALPEVPVYDGPS